ncbi:hypothetical protein IQ266_18740 [filamentous cyanobacterium LEGE 11480]|uniref:Glycerophosphoryl diester phosphodiesterase membrane domain-containing protein n=1 Tax=Romeriopsis navalis LEGE 11480 TaxID=2777977 RepID=A0A928Z5Z6_9CYAN|nr:hypothetical protein [Romeriopsis navalis]MBE9031775.1 hypothetical protein [Romeriopsis navalis LEGE 11480]
MNPTQPIRPLSVGNVVSAGFRLYNDNRQVYLRAALRAIGWTFLGLLYVALIVVLFVGGGVTMAAARQGGDATPIAVLLFIVGFLLILPGIPLWIFCAAKRIYHATLISRNAYMHLANQPEAMSQTHQISRQKIWPFWLARVLVGLILYVPNLAASFLQQIFAIGLGIDNRVAVAVSAFLMFTVILLSWGVQAWLVSRLVIPEVALAVEDDLKTAKSIPRSWMLTQGQGLRILLILFVSFLVTLPLYGLAIVPAVLVAAVLIPWSTIGTSAAASSTAIAAFVLGWVLALGVYLLILQLIELFVMPFWQAVKAVIYYDLRNRREGMGLTLQDRA